MISKETFVKTMLELQSIDSKMDAVDVALKNLNRDFCGFYFTGVFEITLDLLTEAMNDEDEWIYYFVYEKEWLKTLKHGDITVNGEAVRINNWEDVYDFIMKENEKW